jgi:putative transposase
MNEKQKSMLPHATSAYVEILTYCLMPNHYHFQLKQLQSDGIRIFISNVINAFTRYYNILNERKGPLFLPVFHSQIAYSVEQLLHTSRYIHLNPVKDELVRRFSDLKQYKYNSYNEYIGISQTRICNTEIIMYYFNNDVQKYLKFLADDVEHQKVLANLKKLKKKNQYTIYRGNASKNRLS